MGKEVDVLMDKLNSQAREHSDRWKEIDQYYKTLKHLVDSDKYTPENISIGLMSLKLLFLVVDQLRPASLASDKMETVQNEIQNLVDTILSGGKK